MYSSVWRSILFFFGLIMFVVLLGVVFFPGH